MRTGGWGLSVVHSPSACKGRGSLDAQIEFILAAKMKVHYYFNSINIFHSKSDSLLFISILNLHEKHNKTPIQF